MLKRKVNNVICAVITSLFFCSTVDAAGNNTGSKSINYFKVDGTALTVYADNGQHFVDTAAQCNGSSDADAVVILTSRDEYKELYAAIMLAHANGKNVSFFTDGGCYNPGGGNYPTAKMVYVW